MFKRLIRIIFLLSLVLVQSSCFEQVVEQTDLSSKEEPLPPNHPPTTPGTPTTAKPSLLANGTMILGSRYFVASVLRNIFTSSDMAAAQIKAFNDIIDTGVFYYPNVFGGAANLYSTRGLKETTSSGCSLACPNESYQDLVLNQPSTPARSVLLGKTCQRLLDSSTYFTSALNKVGVSVTTPTPDVIEFDNNKISSIYELFYLTSPEPDVATAIAASVAEAKTKGFSRLDQWRFAYLLICESGHWQML